jgi:hypothetical protein
VDDDRWAEVLAQTRQVLVAVARERSTITYDALRARVGADVAGSGERDLAAALRAVSVAADEAGEGLLSAVVVRRSGRPGEGWFRLAEQRGRDVSNGDQAWRAEVERVWRAFSAA